MIISSFRKHLVPSMVMASAAFFGSTAGAGTAYLTNSDPQEQARQLLAPTNPVRPVAPAGSSPVANRGGESVLDPQELARRLLGGAHTFEKTTTAAPAISTVRAGRNEPPGDSQTLAQQMILGVHGTAKTRATKTAAARSRDILE
jgi:hypothetical protein